ncbi:LOW QUALITY PROTEIN: Putative cation exchanger [Saitozyma sp. JCM 24511]|nr:LOW QUALITY PROTEIN: Putative cation exchanger [Saitozyma sp. JCM 24511]
MRAATPVPVPVPVLRRVRLSLVSATGAGQQQQQQELERGKPGRLETVQQESSHRPSPLNPAVSSPISPTSTYRSAASPQRPPSVRSESTSTEDEDFYMYDFHRQPRTPSAAAWSSMGGHGLGAGAGLGAGVGDQTPRMGGISTIRSMPPTAIGSGFGTPLPGGPHQHAQMSSGGSGGTQRPSRLTRHSASTAHLSALAPGTMSSLGGATTPRSGSRHRPALLTNPSTGQLGRGSYRDDEDEAAEWEDRGEELIRRRQKERRAKKKKEQRERERRKAEEETTPEASAPPTGQPEESFAAQQARALGRTGAGERSASRSRGVSATRAGKEPRTSSEGYFASYAGSVSGGETPGERVLSPREELRPPSIHSAAGEVEEEEEAHDHASMVDEVVHEVLEGEIGPVDEEAEDEEIDEDASGEGEEGDEGVTLKDRQDAINIEHPFGLPIWKPALYRKSRSITRNAESALHSIPSAAAERHLLPGNILWVIIFGWWLAIACFAVALLVSGAEVLGGGRGGYGKTLRGLAWYIGWPFGKYVEGEGPPDESDGSTGRDENRDLEYGSTRSAESSMGLQVRNREPSDGASSAVTIRGNERPSSLDILPDEPSPSTAHESAATIRAPQNRREVSFAPSSKAPTPPTRDSYFSQGGEDDEHAPLLKPKGAFRRPRNERAKKLGRLIYWPGFFLVVAPVMLAVCVICWGLVVTIPMAKLNWALLKLLYLRPLEINFRSAPKVPVPTPQTSPPVSAGDSGDTTLADESSPSGFTMRRARLKAGQVAPTDGPKSTVLLCVYRAVGLQYYKYTIGGVNIMFINLVPLVFFTIIDAFLLLPAVERDERRGHFPSPFVAFVTSQALIFVLSLASVIPLSYFIGMAVASISAQSSIGMGAVINATFGSIIEIILYSIALTQGKGRLVEGSIVGSILAGVLLMPGASMCSGALKRKEQKFNAKSAGVTSTMLIMAIIGTLTPTMFYQTYGTFQLHCEGCPDGPVGAGDSSLGPGDAWMCTQCYYEHPDPVTDPFYQDQVKTLMYCCAAILVFSYLIGLWFSLRTHASQIWQNPQQLMKVDEIPAGAMHPAVRTAVQQRLTPQAVMQHILPVHGKPGAAPSTQTGQPQTPTLAPSSQAQSPQAARLQLPSEGARGHDRGPSTASQQTQGTASTGGGGGGGLQLPAGYSPLVDTVDRDVKSHVSPMRLPSSLTPEDFTRAVAVATVSALRHQGSFIGGHHPSGHKSRPVSGIETGAGDEDEGHGGHEAPSWNRTVSSGVLLGCTLLYAIIAEILVDVVDVVMQGSGIDEKFLGLTLFALVPNTTEFMNAMSFAMTGNIALSMEIGSAYALQVCLLQIPAMVAFSAFYDPGRMGASVDTFTLIFPRWDVIAIILSIFLLTYTYIEARSNYHRGSILVLAYIVLVMGFYYAPVRAGDPSSEIVFGGQAMESAKAGLRATMSLFWA